MGKVSIVTGGGSGHLPVFLGYVGRGLADGVAVGNVFRSPSSEQILDATRAVNGGKGAIYLYGNYTGDIVNFDFASELAAAEGIETRTVLVADDVASAPPSGWERRRGVAGLFFAYKITGAIAESGGSLDEVERVARKVISNTRTMGVALSPCTVPDIGRPTFEIGENEMEIGMGIHGEPGVQRGPVQPADDVVEVLVHRLLSEPVFGDGGQVAVLVNGLGATPREELYILYRKTATLLKERNMQIGRTYIGEFATSLEMAGASLTLLKLDPELLELLDAPARSPFFEQGLRQATNGSS
jgi:dihydroxyacetone kinase